MLRHLIQVMTLAPNLPYKDYSLHPYFWNIMRCVSFENRMRTFTSTYQSYSRTMDRLNREQHVVFKGSWARGIPETVKKAILTPEGGAKACPNEYTFTGLCMCRRNRTQHFDNDEREVRRYLGTLPSENFMFWESRFPNFILFLFQQSLSFRLDGEYICQHHEFSEYYGGSEAFHAACRNVDVPVIPEFVA